MKRYCFRPFGVALTVVSLLLLSVSSVHADDKFQEFTVELGAISHDFVIDDVRGQVYVSLPSRNEIAVVSTSSLQVTDRIFVGPGPRGIDMSADGKTLYAALNGAGSIAVVDLDTGDVEEVVLATLLDDPRTWDVMEGLPGEVFVTSSPGSSGFAYIVRVDTNNSNSAARVASNRIIRASPTLAKDPDNDFMYVGSGFSPNSLYKLDIRDETAPIILEDDHGSVSGTTVSLTVNSTGDRILTGSGQYLRTGSFTQAGIFGGGASTLSDDDQFVYVVSQAFNQDLPTINTYLVDTFLQVDSFSSTECNASNSNRRVIRTLPGGTGWLVMSSDLLCVFTALAPRDLQLLPGSGQVLEPSQFDVSIVLRADGLSIVSLDSLAVDGVDIAGMPERCYPGNLSEGQPLLLCPNVGRGFIKNRGDNLMDVTATVTLSDGTTVQAQATWEVLPASVAIPTLRPNWTR